MAAGDTMCQDAEHLSRKRRSGWNEGLCRQGGAVGANLAGGTVRVSASEMFHVEHRVRADVWPIVYRFLRAEAMPAARFKAVGPGH
jgi:hypothetical protein